MYVYKRSPKVGESKLLAHLNHSIYKLFIYIFVNNGHFIHSDSRQYEVVRDPVEHSLNAEAKLISQIRVLLKDKCEAAWDKLATLEDIRQRLELDLQDKTTALAIDINQIELSERSGGISHKPEAIKCPNGYASDDMH